MKIKTTLLMSAVLFSLSGSIVSAGYGSSPANHDAPTCNNEKPGQASFSYVRKLGTNEIEVGWNSTEKATSWTIAYGKESGKYIYGMSDFGDSNSRSVKINMLPVGTYYLVLKANNGCMPGNFSPERRMTVFNNGDVLGKSVTPTPEQVVYLTGTQTTPSASPTQALNQEIIESKPTESKEKNYNFIQNFFRWLLRM